MTTRTCRHCKKPFVAKVSMSPPQTCSLRCAAALDQWQDRADAPDGCETCVFVLRDGPLRACRILRRLREGCFARRVSV